MSRWIESAAAAVMLVALSAGLAVMILGGPWFTRVLSDRYALVSESGLTRVRMLALAEDVRAFVFGENAAGLPSEVDGRPGFDESAVAHLGDVASVLRAARWATLVAAAAVVAWVALSLRRRRYAAVRDGLWSGAALSLVLVLVAALAGTMDFGAFFSAFHGLFFAEGTWTFGYDSLLIQLFPEPFWVTAGVAWATLIGVFAGGMLVGAAAAQRASRRPDA